MRQAGAGVSNGEGKLLEIAALVQKCDGALDRVWGDQGCHEPHCDSTTGA